MVIKRPSLAHLHGRPLSDGFLRSCAVSKAYLQQAQQAAQDPDLAIFGYGSLMWNPGFKPAFMHSALLPGYSRRACIWSTVYRGTPSSPGLVFGLDAGGSCRGMALGLPRSARAKIIRQLFVREMFQGTYRPALLHAYAKDKTIPCLTFVADRSSPSYAGRLSTSKVRSIVAHASGQNGSCLDYWRRTQAKLAECGIIWQPGFDLQRLG